jgi:hypothetical protein
MYSVGMGVGEYRRSEGQMHATGGTRRGGKGRPSGQNTTSPTAFSAATRRRGDDIDHASQGNGDGRALAKRTKRLDAYVDAADDRFLRPSRPSGSRLMSQQPRAQETFDDISGSSADELAGGSGHLPLRKQPKRTAETEEQQRLAQPSSLSRRGDIAHTELTSESADINLSLPIKRAAVQPCYCYARSDRLEGDTQLCLTLATSVTDIARAHRMPAREETAETRWLLVDLKTVRGIYWSPECALVRILQRPDSTKTVALGGAAFIEFSDARHARNLVLWARKSKLVDNSMIHQQEK